MIGLLNSGGYHSNYTLAETRILFEINEVVTIQASQIMLKVHIDKSYLSRILRRLERDGLIIRQRSNLDSRVITLTISPQGKSEIEKINRAASDRVKDQIQQLDESDCQQLVNHMNAVKQLLNFEQ